MNYAEQLGSISWKNKRKEILERDNFTCRNCKNTQLLDKCEKGEIEKIDDKTNILVNFAQGWGEDFKKYKLVIINKNKQKAPPIYITEFQFKQLSDRDIKIGDIVYYKITIKQNSNHDNIGAIFNKNQGIVRNDKIEIHGISDDHGLKVVKNLHVHHKYYQIGKLAWEYPNEALETLCWHCHEKLHSECEIDILDENGNIIETRKRCNRCLGAGRFPEYNHIQNGICFECNGERFEN